MGPANPLRSVLRFEGFEFDQTNGVLRKQGEIIPLQDKPLQLLGLFLEYPGQILTREQIQERLWGKDTFFDADGSLNQAVKKLRKALGDPAMDPHFIQTVARRGYRFAAVHIQEDGDQESGGHTPAAQDLPGTGGLSPSLASHMLSRLTISKRVLAIAAVAMVGAAIILPAMRSRRDETNREEAIRAWRSGMELLRRRDLVSAQAAATELRRALDLDPEFAQAWAGLAEASVLFLNPDDAQGPLEMVQRSIRLDPQCGECRAMSGFLLYTRFWKWQEAEAELRRALSLNTDEPQIWYWLAQLQAALGRPTECLRLLNDALGRFPNAFNLLVMKAGCQYFGRDYAATIETSDRALAVNHPGGWTWRARALFLSGRHEQAVRSLAFDLGAYTSRSLQWVSERADLFEVRYRTSGLEGVLGDLLEQTSSPAITHIHSPNRAAWFILLGKHNSAVDELETAVAVKPPRLDLIYLGVDPLFDPLRSNPRFRALLRQMRFSVNSI
jgi:DNA-binding winged helix-turn-helix (wHTH) protein/Tfp pilus assembly protein PilF